MKPAPAEPFWRTKRLEEMTAAEWESLCDGCGRCCLVKLEYEDTGAIDFTDIACRLLDTHSCRCRDYKHRRTHVEDCVKLTPRRLRSIRWLPPSCAYRLVDEGRDLYWWHPLVSGDPQTVHLAGISVRGRVRSEDEVTGPPEEHIVRWPGRIPPRAAQKPGSGGPGTAAGDAQASDRGRTPRPSRRRPIGAPDRDNRQASGS